MLMGIDDILALAKTPEERERKAAIESQNMPG